MSTFISSYSYVVERQPIGKLLFQQFCESTTQYFRCCKFLERVEEYEMSDDDGEIRRELAKSIAALLVSPAGDQPTTVIFQQGLLTMVNNRIFQILHFLWICVYCIQLVKSCLKFISIFLNLTFWITA